MINNDDFLNKLNKKSIYDKLSPIIEECIRFISCNTDSEKEILIVLGAIDGGALISFNTSEKDCIEQSKAFFEEIIKNIKKHYSSEKKTNDNK